MNADKSVDLLNEMTEDLLHMPEIAARLGSMVRWAIDDWNALSDPQFFRNDLTVTEDVDDLLDTVVIRTREIKEDLRDLDWLLANVIRLRGKLAEELGVPMMSHLKGSDGFGRTSAEFKM